MCSLSFSAQSLSRETIVQTQTLLGEWCVDPSTTPTQRMYLLRFWDMWAKVVDEVSATTKTTLVPDDVLDVSHAPCPVTCHPFVIQHLFQEKAKLVLLGVNIYSSEEEHDPFIAVMRKAWPMKYQQGHCMSKILKSLANKRHTHEIAPWLIECLVMSKLGAYASSRVQAPLLDWKVRAEYLHWWRQRWDPDVYASGVLRDLVTESTFQVVLALKEFLFQAIEYFPPWKEWFQERSHWDQHVGRLAHLCDAFRKLNHQNCELRSGRLSTVPVSLRTAFKQICADNRDLTQPGHFWRFASRQFRPKTVQNWTVPTWWTREHDASVRQAAQLFFEHQAVWETYGPDAYEQQILTRQWHVKEVYQVQCLLILRWITIVATLYRLPRVEREAMLQPLRLFYGNSNKDSQLALDDSESESRSLVMDSLYRSSPLGARLLLLLCEEAMQRDRVWAMTLPYSWTSLQIEAIQRRFEDKPFVPPCDLLLYCPSCNTMRSMVTQHRAHGSSKATRFNPRAIAGFVDVVADLEHDKIYCGRKNGIKRTVCKTTELVKVPLLGKMFMFHDHIYMLCPMVNCSNVMELDVGTLLPDYSFACCSTCYDKCLSKKRKKKRMSSLVQVSKERRPRKKKSSSSHSRSSRVLQLSTSDPLQAEGIHITL